MPLSYQTAAAGQHLISNNSHGYQYAPSVGQGGAPMMSAGINQKLAHQFMLKQQFKYVEQQDMLNEMGIID